MGQLLFKLSPVSATCQWEWQESQPKRDIIIGIHDDLLNPEIAISYWKDHASKLKNDAGHHIENFDHLLTILQ